MKVLILLLLSSAIVKGYKIDLKLCKPGGEDLPVPTLPLYYSTKIQINRLDEFNSEGFSNYVELDILNRTNGPLLKKIKTKKTSFESEIIKGLHQTSLVKGISHGNDATCVVQKYDNIDSFYPFDGTSFTSPDDLIRYLNTAYNKKWKFLKQKNIFLIENVITDLWQACYFDQNRNSTYRINFHWSNATTWAGSNCEIIDEPICQSVPVYLEISEKGWLYSRFFQTKLSFSFYDFKEELHPLEYFQVPKGIFCKNDGNTKRYPTIKTDSQVVKFSIQTSLNRSDSGSTKSFTVAYDRAMGLETITDELGEQFITNFHPYYRYRISKLNPFFNTICEANLTIGYPEFLGSNSFKNFLEMINLKSKPYSYNGKYNVGRKTVTNFVGKIKQEKFTCIVSWDMTENGKKAESVLITCPDINGNIKKIYLQFSYWEDFNNLNEDQFKFDVSKCFDYNNTKHLSIDFELESGHDVKEDLSMKTIRENIAQIANVSILRIGSLQPEYQSRLKFKIRFDLAGPLFNDTGEIDEISSEEAWYNLQEAFKMNKLTVYVPRSSLGKAVALFDGSSRIDEISSTPKPTTQNEVSSTSEPKTHTELGLLVGLAIGMLVLGIMIGGGIVYFVFKRYLLDLRKEYEMKSVQMN